MPKINWFSLNWRKCKRHRFLKNLPSLEYLSLEETNVKDISPIKYLENLKV